MDGPSSARRMAGETRRVPRSGSRSAHMVLVTFAVTKVTRRRRKLLLLADRWETKHLSFPVTKAGRCNAEALDLFADRKGSHRKAEALDLADRKVCHRETEALI